jgi:hypothetical protein
MSINKFKIALLALLIIAGMFLAYTAFAGTESDPGGSGDPLVTQSYVDQYVQWKVVELKTGQVLTGSAGTEIIVRRGQAVVVDPVGNGIPDVTSGVDIYAGSTITNNHLLIIPRDDERAIGAKSDIVVMYRGGASVK